MNPAQRAAAPVIPSCEIGTFLITRTPSRRWKLQHGFLFMLRHRCCAAEDEIGQYVLYRRSRQNNVKYTSLSVTVLLAGDWLFSIPLHWSYVGQCIVVHVGTVRIEGSDRMVQPSLLWVRWRCVG